MTRNGLLVWLSVLASFIDVRALGPEIHPIAPLTSDAWCLNVTPIGLILIKSRYTPYPYDYGAPMSYLAPSIHGDWPFFTIYPHPLNRAKGRF